MIITGRQIRAARALLEWSAEELADKAGLSRVTIANIETDKITPQIKSMSGIIGVFEKHGVQFLPDDGVQMRRHEIRVYSGKHGYRQFLDHVYDILDDAGGGRIRQFNLSDANNLSFVDDYSQSHLVRMATIENLDARVLTQDGDKTFPAIYCEYRYLEKGNQALAPFYVFNDYLAMPMYESAHKRELLVIHSKLLAERYCEQFDMLWKNAKIARKRFTGVKD